VREWRTVSRDDGLASLGWVQFPLWGSILAVAPSWAMGACKSNLASLILLIKRRGKWTTHSMSCSVITVGNLWVNQLSVGTAQWFVPQNAERRWNVGCLFCGKERWEHEDDRTYLLGKHVVYSKDHYVRWMRRENALVYVVISVVITIFVGGLTWLFI